MVLKDLIIDILFLLVIILYLFKKKNYLLFIPFILCFIHIKISNENLLFKTMQTMLKEKSFTLVTYQKPNRNKEMYED